MTREIQLEALLKISGPVLGAGCKGELKSLFRSEGRETGPSEAVFRTVAGLAPWLEVEKISEGEKTAQEAVRAQTLEMLERAIDPSSQDFLPFGMHRQNLVEGGLLGLALLRAPKTLGALEKKDIKQALIATRTIKPSQNNWLLFSAIVECCLCRLGERPNKEIIVRALRTFNQWHLGDGLYSDGERFLWNHYSSSTINPLLREITKVCEEENLPGKEWLDPVKKRNTRMAETIESLVSPDGTFPIIGRSAGYRTGVIHSLSTAALHDELPLNCSPGGIRCAIDAMVIQCFKKESFDESGILRPGICGNQPSTNDWYTTRGSPYFCLLGFAQLGLDPKSPFWKAAGEDWTQKKLWSGTDINIPQGLKERENPEASWRKKLGKLKRRIRMALSIDWSG